MCNQNFTFEPTTTEPPPVNGKVCILSRSFQLNCIFLAAVEPVVEPTPSVTVIVTSAVIAIILISSLIGVAYYWYRRHKYMFNEVRVQ